MAVKIAMIGAGWVCEARHIPALRRIPGVEIVGIVDPDEARARAVAAKFRLPNVSSATAARDVPWLAQATAVSISTPPRFHHDWMADGLDLGKDVLIEKPVALSRDEIADLDARAKKSGAMIGVMHNTLFSRSSIRARRLVADGAIGRLSAVQIRLLNSPRRHLPDWYEALPFGLLYDELSHFLYHSDSLVANLRVRGAEVFPSPKGNATPALATLRLEGDSAPVDFSLNFESPVCEWHMTLVGEKGLLVNDMFRDILVRLPDDREHHAADHFRTLALATAGVWSGFANSGWRHLAGRLDFGVGEVMRRFVAACETRQPPERISWADALRVFALLQECIDALGQAARR
jgi:scyllo-inositol 2-dehydrogenase (NADP+)